MGLAGQRFPELPGDLRTVSVDQQDDAGEAAGAPGPGHRRGRSDYLASTDEVHRMANAWK
jgi:hypothetical protein